MVRKRFFRLALVGLFVLSAGTWTRAEAPDGLKLTGFINDYTVASAGSWEIHGAWSLHAKGSSGKADFSAALTMERSDYWLATTPSADPNNPATRNAHTHHIDVTDAAVTAIPNGFRLTGAATITANGSTPPFGTASTIQIDITGGDLVELSNVKLTFGGNAVSHFGAQPLSGVIRTRR